MSVFRVSDQLLWVQMSLSSVPCVELRIDKSLVRFTLQFYKNLSRPISFSPWCYSSASLGRGFRSIVCCKPDCGTVPGFGFFVLRQTSSSTDAPKRRR